MTVFAAVAATLIAALLTFWLYRWALGAELPRAARTALPVILYLPLPVYLYAGIADSGTLLYWGSVWLSAVHTMFVLTFAEIAATRLFPQKKRIWMLLTVVLSVFLAALLMHRGIRPAAIQDYIVELTGTAISFGLYYLLYKRLTLRLRCTERGGGILILVLWASALASLAFSHSPMLIVFLWMNYFIFYRISSGLELTRRGSIATALVLAFGVIFGFQQSTFAGDIYNSHPLYTLGGIDLGIVGIAFTMFFVEMIVSLVFRSWRRYTVAVMLVLTLVISGYSIYNGARMPAVREITVPLDDLPDRASGFTVVQLSDLHLGALLPPDWFEKIVDEVNNLDPGLVVITGDFFEHDFSDGERFRAIIGKIRSQNGVLGVLGNHEYYYGIEQFQENIRGSDIRLLQDETVVIDSVLVVAGISDGEGIRNTENNPGLVQVLAGAEPGLPVMLLSHRPDVFDRAAELGVGLQLSGHTHAGQIPPMDLIVRLVFRYPYGLYEKNGSYLYTSCGTGFWGVPMRLFSRSEIVKIILVSK